MIMILSLFVLLLVVMLVEMYFWFRSWWSILLRKFRELQTAYDRGHRHYQLVTCSPVQGHLRR